MSLPKRDGVNDRCYQIDIAGFPVKAGAVGAPKLMGGDLFQGSDETRIGLSQATS